MQVSLTVDEMMDYEPSVKFARYLELVIQARLYGRANGFTVLVKRMKGLRAGTSSGQTLFFLFLLVTYLALVGTSTTILQVFRSLPHYSSTQASVSLSHLPPFSHVYFLTPALLTFFSCRTRVLRPGL